MGIPVNTAKPNKGNQKQMMHNQNQGQQNSFGNQNDFGNQNGHSSMWQGNMAHGSVIGTRENIKIILLCLLVYPYCYLQVPKKFLKYTYI